MRTCTKCNEPKTLDCFGTYTDKRFGKSKLCTYTWCKPCMNKQCSDWHKANPEKILGGQLKKYWPGSTWQEALANYTKMFDEQNGVCDICSLPETAVDKKYGKVRRMAVDHCHETGKVRALLCGNCNQILGKLKDSVLTAYKVVSYLSKHTGIADPKDDKWGPLPTHANHAGEDL